MGRNPEGIRDMLGGGQGYFAEFCPLEGGQELQGKGRGKQNLHTPGRTY